MPSWWMRGALEGLVGVALVLLSVGVVIIFVILCWGLLWKTLLSRLGLFRELFSSNGTGPSQNKEIHNQLTRERGVGRSGRGNVKWAESLDQPAAKRRTVDVRSEVKRTS